MLNLESEEYYADNDKINMDRVLTVVCQNLEAAVKNGLIKSYFAVIKKRQILVTVYNCKEAYPIDFDWELKGLLWCSLPYDLFEWMGLEEMIVVECE